MTSNVQRIGTPGYIQRAPRLVIVPDLSALTSLTGSLDAALEEIASWTDLALAEQTWCGLIVADPHTCQRDQLCDDVTATWSDWAEQHHLMLSLVQPLVCPNESSEVFPMASFSASTTRIDATVQMYSKEHLKAPTDGSTESTFSWFNAAMKFISATSGIKRCELVLLDIVDAQLSPQGVLLMPTDRTPVLAS